MAGERPSDGVERKDKKNYGQRLSTALAFLFANQLRQTQVFPAKAILPDKDGTGLETAFKTGKAKMPKRTDVTYSTAQSGLELLISIKTLNFKDKHTDQKTKTVTYSRFTRNVVRNDHELRAEAMDQHDRHPYAVIIGAYFCPIEACDDAGERGDDRSSFAHAVIHFRFRSGRKDPHGPTELFERFFIGLYEHQGAKKGEVCFFDVAAPPPKKGRPKKDQLLSLEDVIQEVTREYGLRNRHFIEWAGETHEVPSASLKAALAATEQVSREEDDAEEDEDE